jgi:hypothetical protein
MSKLNSATIVQYIINHNKHFLYAKEMDFSPQDINEWNKPKNWLRNNKNRLEHDDSYQTEFDFGILDGGDLDKNLLNQQYDLYVQNNKNSKFKPWFRMFIMKEYLNGDHRVEVLTTHDDTQIIGFTYVVD